MKLSALLLLAAAAAAVPVANPPRLATLPAASPDGRTIAYCVVRDSTHTADLFLVDAQTGIPRRLTYSDDDWGPPAWSADGRRVVAPVTRGDSVQIRALAIDGSGMATVFTALAKAVRLSNAGTRVVYTVGGWTRGRVWVASPDGTHARALTDSTAGWFNFAWSPDDRRIAVTRLDSTQALQICLLDPAGGKPRELVRLPAADGRPQWPAWSPDGRSIAFQAGNYVREDPAKSDAYVCVVDVASGAIRKLRQHPKPWLDETPSWLDARRIAFQSTQSGAFQVWVMNADGSGARQITK